MSSTPTVITSCVALAAVAALGLGLTGAANTTSSTDGLSGDGAVSVATALGPALMSAQPTAGIPPQVMPVTVQPNASQLVSVSVPGDRNPLPIPALSTSTADLFLASASCSEDGKYLLVSLINVNPQNPTSAKLSVAGWGTYDVTVAPNPSQRVLVALPSDYRPPAFPRVTSQDPNLTLMSLSYQAVGDTVMLAVDLRNPFPNRAVSGNIRIAW
jgi:hypothetical protein